MPRSPLPVAVGLVPPSWPVALVPWAPPASPALGLVRGPPPTGASLHLPPLAGQVELART